ncbi:MAG: hypothetical protein WC477_05975 [Patescibacteria group bacterium]
MRELSNADMYLISAIADKMDLGMPELKKKVDGVEVSKTQDEVGSEMLVSMFKRLHRAQPEVNQLLSRVLEKPVDEIEKMSLKETGQNVALLFGKKGFMDFFK